MTKLAKALTLAAALGWVVAAGAAIDIDGRAAIVSNDPFRGLDLGNWGNEISAKIAYTASKLEGSAWYYQYNQLDSNWMKLDGRFGIDLAGQAYGPVWWTAGWRFYDWRKFLGGDFAEVQLGAKLKMPGNPGIDWFYGYQGSVGSYVALSAEHSFHVRGNWYLDTDGHVGWELGRGLDSFRDLGLRAGLMWHPLPGLRVGPRVLFESPHAKIDTYGAHFVGALEAAYHQSF